jgi:hypothetical protein
LDAVAWSNQRQWAEVTCSVPHYKNIYQPLREFHQTPQDRRGLGDAEETEDTLKKSHNRLITSITQ